MKDKNPTRRGSGRQRPVRRELFRHRECRALPGFADDNALPQHLLAKLGRPLRPAPTATKRAA